MSFSKAKFTYFKIKNKKEAEKDITYNIKIRDSNGKEIKAKEYKKTEEKNIKTEEINQNIWQIEIPSINLVAPIAEGTTQEIMNKFVGHFESTNKWDGNVGLAAHNRRLSC